MELLYSVDVYSIQDTSLVPRNSGQSEDYLRPFTLSSFALIRLDGRKRSFVGILESHLCFVHILGLLNFPSDILYYSQYLH